MILFVVVVIIFAIVIHNKNQQIAQLKYKIQKLEKQVNILLTRLQNESYKNSNVTSDMYEKTVNEENILTTKEVVEEKAQYDIFDKSADYDEGGINEPSAVAGVVSSKNLIIRGNK